MVVQFPSSELVDALNRGAVSGTFDSNQDNIANQLGDLVKYVTEIGLGVYNGAATTTASRALWDRMDPDDRAALARASQYGIAKGVTEFLAGAEAARDVERIEFIAMDDTLKEAKQSFIDQQLADAAMILKRRGVTYAQAKIDRYALLVGKWEGLITENMTAEDVAQLRYDEIFSKLDLASYGK